MIVSHFMKQHYNKIVEDNMNNKKIIKTLFVIILLIIVLGTTKVLGNKQDDNRIGDKELQQIIENLENENLNMESHEEVDDNEEFISIIKSVSD